MVDSLWAQEVFVAGLDHHRVLLEAAELQQPLAQDVHLAEVSQQPIKVFRSTTAKISSPSTSA